MGFVFNDGGRAKAGFIGTAGDCVVRAIAIATDADYRTLYMQLQCAEREHAELNGRKPRSIRDGAGRHVYETHLLANGWLWKPTMGFGTGCRTHLRPDELPGGTIIARVSKHLCTMVDGVIHDTHDPSRGGTRCVYGYFYKPGWGNRHAEPTSTAPLPSRPRPATPANPKRTGGSVRDAIEAMGGSIDRDEYADARPGYTWDANGSATLTFDGDWSDLRERACYGMTICTPEEAAEISFSRDEDWTPPAGAPATIAWPKLRGAGVKTRLA